MCRKGQRGVYPPVGRTPKATKDCSARGCPSGQEAARQAAREGRTQDDQPMDTEEAPTEKRKDDKLRYWTAPFKWGKTSRGGPPLERLLPVMSTVSILSVSVSGGEADPAKLWPECKALGSRVSRHSGKICGSREIGVRVTCGSHKVLEKAFRHWPLDKDPREDRFLLDQLVDTGSRTVEGMGAVNGEMLRRLRGAPDPEKGDLLPFEEACQNLREARDAAREIPIYLSDVRRRRANCSMSSAPLWEGQDRHQHPKRAIHMMMTPSLRMMALTLVCQMRCGAAKRNQAACPWIGYSTRYCSQVHGGTTIPLGFAFGPGGYPSLIQHIGYEGRILFQLSV